MKPGWVVVRSVSQVQKKIWHFKKVEFKIRNQFEKCSMSKSSSNQGKIYFQSLKKAITIVKSNVQGTNITNV